MIKLKYEPKYIKWELISDSQAQTRNFEDSFDLYLLERQEPIERMIEKFKWTRTEKTIYLNHYWEIIHIITTIATGELAKEHNRSTTEPSLKPDTQ